MKYLSLTTLTTSCLVFLTGCGSDKTYVATNPIVDTSELTAQYIELANRTYELGNTNEKLTATNNALTNQFNQLKNAQITATAGDAGELESKIATLKAELEAAGKAVDEKTLKEQLEKAQTELAGANTATNTADTELLAKQKQLKDLKTQLQALKAAQNGLGDVETALNDTKSANSKLAEENEKLKKEIEELTKNEPKKEVTAKLTKGLEKLNSTTLSYAEGQKTGFIIATDSSTEDAIIDSATAVIDPSKNSNLTELNIGNTKVTLLANTNSATALQQLEASHLKDGVLTLKGDSWVGGFTALRFGVIADDEDITRLFIYGEPNNNSSLKSATYKGSAIIGNKGEYRTLENSVQADLDITKNKLKINIQGDKSETLHFISDVSGTRFNGTEDTKIETEPTTKSDGKTAGAFFGEKELGGFFEVTNSDSAYVGEHGVFGAALN